MAMFRGTVKGNRGLVSRLGGKKSGIRTEANGWNVGVSVIGHELDGKIIFYVHATSGSNNRTCGKLIAIIKEDEITILPLEEKCSEQ
jgi:hypothetical protein